MLRWRMCNNNSIIACRGGESVVNNSKVACRGSQSVINNSKGIGLCCYLVAAPQSLSPIIRKNTKKRPTNRQAKGGDHDSGPKGFRLQLELKNSKTELCRSRDPALNLRGSNPQRLSLTLALTHRLSPVLGKNTKKTRTLQSKKVEEESRAIRL